MHSMVTHLPRGVACKLPSSPCPPCLPCSLTASPVSIATTCSLCSGAVLQGKLRTGDHLLSKVPKGNTDFMIRVPALK